MKVMRPRRNKHLNKSIVFSSMVLAIFFGVVLSSSMVVGAAPLSVPKVNVNVSPATNPNDVATSIQVLLLFTVLSLAPSILIMMTSFTRIMIVLSFLRNAIGTQQTPPNQVMTGLALFLTLFIMMPTFKTINNQAIQPYMSGKITQSQAFSRAEKPIKKFMLDQIHNKKDLELFAVLSREKVKRSNPPLYIVIPAFIISELKTAFQIGFFIYIPFLVIDMVVASTLMSMGMMMLPPVMISLPFKLLLFVMVDGWSLLVQALVKTFTI